MQEDQHGSPGRDSLLPPFHAFLLIFESHAFILLACDPKLRSYLTLSVLCILNKEIRAGFPALATAYAALSIYYYVDHKIILAYQWILNYFIVYFNALLILQEKLH